MENKVVAIVPAAGLGERFGEGTNKPFSSLGDKPLIIWAVEALQSRPGDRGDHSCSERAGYKAVQPVV